jgi:hypothetical protein
MAASFDISDYVEVYVHSAKLGRSIRNNYHETICIGELIRNCCVNLGFFDVDTVNGLTLNASVRRGSKIWKYNPMDSLGDVLSGNDNVLGLRLEIEPLD